MAVSTSGWRTLQTSPSTARVANQSSMTGPKMAPIPAVPRRWKTKSTTRIAIVMGTTKGSKNGVATCSPSTALRTEMAGVIMPSP